jgi:hypothetical protein
MDQLKDIKDKLIDESTEQKQLKFIAKYYKLKHTKNQHKYEKTLHEINVLLKDMKLINEDIVIECIHKDNNDQVKGGIEKKLINIDDEIDYIHYMNKTKAKRMLGGTKDYNKVMNVYKGIYGGSFDIEKVKRKKEQLKELLDKEDIDALDDAIYESLKVTDINNEPQTAAEQQTL